MIDMTPYSCMTREELEREYGSVLASYEACKAQGLKLNMARGKPATEQLDMVSGLLTVLQTPEDCYDDGVDARNYGELAGIPSARAYWADVLGCKVIRPAVIETTALGAALLAGLAVGVWKDMDEIRRVWQMDLSLTPQMTEQEREKTMTLWHRAVKRSMRWAAEEK